ncbi:hypothetical protein BD560DRAFT_370020 [Blakeslea trispora]|nr:hypothetical protein BD560DRAFT_370020 [Blakeslea trispora]
MKFFGASIFISAAYLASFVLAQEPAIISITSPLSNTKYKAGQEAIISWVNPQVDTIDRIVLAKGPSTALVPIKTIAENVKASDLKYVWAIPKDMESGNDYAFEFGTSPKMAFAGPFTIESSNGSSNTQNTVPVNKNNVAVAAASPASPNSSSSPSGSSTNTGSAQTPSHSNAAHTSGANKQAAGQTIAALGMAAVVAAQFF